MSAVYTQDELNTSFSASTSTSASPWSNSAYRLALLLEPEATAHTVLAISGAQREA